MSLCVILILKLLSLRLPFRHDLKKQASMGNICSGSSEEGKKQPLLESPQDAETDVDYHDDSKGVSILSSQDAASNGVGTNPLQQSPEMTAPEQALLQEQQKKRIEEQRLEQARLDMVVQAAGRRMVAVRSTRGSNAYYDQGFAAALSQHLEQTTKFKEHVDHPLPTTHSTPVYERLSQPAWDGIQLGVKEGTAGLAGESPHLFFDRVVAEPFLEDVVPKKERLFAGVEPMVESLL
uniref:Uncharacterized protein n=1 Tax=Entomoneis paludosa TaxID=265537 RepID=A0A7S2YNJ3_9STRA